MRLGKMLGFRTWLAYFIAVIVLVAYVRKCPTDCVGPLIAQKSLNLFAILVLLGVLFSFSAFSFFPFAAHLYL